MDDFEDKNDTKRVSRNNAEKKRRDQFNTLLTELGNMLNVMPEVRLFFHHSQKKPSSFRQFSKNSGTKKSPKIQVFRFNSIQ